MSMLRKTPIVGERENATGHVPVATRRWTKLGLSLVTVVLLAGGATVYFRHVEERAPVAATPPPLVPVIATTVQQRDFPIVVTGIGNVTALNTATVRSMVTEQIVSIDFKDGQSVTKGQLLAQLDPSTFQSQLDQEQANLARDQPHPQNEQININR